MTFLSGIWMKVAAVGAILLAILFAVWRVFAKGESVGAAKETIKQQKAADEAKAKMDDAKEVKGDGGTTSDLDRGSF